MIPFEEEFYIDKFNKYYSKLNNSKFNGKTIIERTLNVEEGYLFVNDSNPYNNGIKILELRDDKKVYMELSPREVQGSFEAIKKVRGKVGVVGLGMGYFLQEILYKEDVTQIIVYEQNKDIIDLYKKNFGEDDKVTLLNINAFEAEKEHFDFFFVDIYDYKLSENVVEHYIKFNALHDINEYLFWGMEHFLLSCKVEDIAWVYVPELWMGMARGIFERFSDSRYFCYYKSLDEYLVKDVLKKFAEVLN